MRSLEDIDEDEPAPIVIGSANCNNNTSSNGGGANVMDDLFGPSTGAPAVSSSNNNNNSNHNNNSNSSAATTPPPKDALDDFFGGGGAKRPANTNSTSSHNNVANGNNKNDVFDSLFSGNSPNQNSNGNNNNNFNSVNNNGSTTTTTTRSAIDHLDAFSAISKGAAVPWKQNTSVADSKAKVLDIFGDGSGGGSGSADGIDSEGRGVFIPPDQVLSLMTLYDVVGAAQNWSVEDISKAYKKKAILLHPDKLPGGKRTDKEDRYFKLITAAYDVLKDKEKRAEYDAALRHGGGSQGSWLNFVS